MHGATLADNTAPEPLLGVLVAEGSEGYRERERLLAHVREEVDALKAEQAREGWKNCWRAPRLTFAAPEWCRSSRERRRY